MSTRGVTGFVADGKWFLSYNHSDSYPEWLGMRVLEFCKQVEDWNALRENVLSVTLVDENVSPTPEEIDLYMGYYANPNERILGYKREYVDWYWLLHSLQGEGLLYEVEKGNLKHMTDYHGFLANSLLCEWGYVIDLDDMTLKVYKGFQETPPVNTPLPPDISPDYFYESCVGVTKYYPCKMLYAYSLYNLPKFMLGVTNKFKEEYHKEHPTSTNI